jgi:formylmethanofuran dehydrogenase subunit A
MTFREFCLRALAHERQEVSKWQHTRWLGLKIIEPHLKKDSKVTVFDILPLPNDPTKDDLKVAREINAKGMVAKGEAIMKKYEALEEARKKLALENAPTTDIPTPS